jgi:hypothetical protein
MDRTFLVLSFAVVGAVVAFIWAGGLPAQAISEVAAGTVGTILTSLMFVALLIERAVEVFISPTSGVAKDALKTEQTKLADTIKLQQVALELARNPGAGLIPDEAAVKVAAEALARSVTRDKEIAELIRIADRQTQKVALSFSIPIGFIAALAGLRTIGSFVPGLAAVNNADVTVQQQLLTALDVVLTAGLLAGGADGIHKILDRFIKIASGEEKPATTTVVTTP